MLDTRLYTSHSTANAFHSDHHFYDPDKPRIKDIIWNNYDWLLQQEKDGKCRPVVIEEIQKTLLCNTIYLGYDAFGCTHCNNINILCHHCHSKFCSSCGIKHQKELAAKAEFLCLDAPHRHIVFTIPEQFRVLFRYDRSSLNLLFIAARNTVCKVINEKLYRRFKRNLQKQGRHINPKDNTYLLRNFKDQLLFGMISSIHTFGRDLKWNPHIHALVAEIVYNPVSDSYKKLSHFNFNALRKTWQYEICRLLKEFYQDSSHHSSCMNTINLAYKNNIEGFYVYAKQRKEECDDSQDHAKNASDCVNYMMRYASRPAMAESRIVSYDNSTNTVHWFYNDHKTEQRIDVTESAQSLLIKMCMHIHEKNFRTVRYYGFYNNKCRTILHRIYELMGKNNKSSRSLQNRNKSLKLKTNKLRFRSFCLDSYNRDVLSCGCGGVFVYEYSFNPLEGDSNDRTYRENSINEMRDMRLHRRSTNERYRTS